MPVRRPGRRRRDAFVRSHELDIQRERNGRPALKANVVSINPARPVVKVRLHAEEFGVWLNVDLGWERFNDLRCRAATRCTSRRAAFESSSTTSRSDPSKGESMSRDARRGKRFSLGSRGAVSPNAGDRRVARRRARRASRPRSAGSRFGTVTAVVQNGVVVQVERTEKVRLQRSDRHR